MELPKWVPNKVVHICAPTWDQAIDIYWPVLAYDLNLDDVARKCSKDAGKFEFDNGTELRLISYEAIERLRGKGSYFFLWDEISSCKKGINPAKAWESIIKPCITTRWSTARAKEYGAKSPGRALLVSTPEGYNFFHQLCMMHEVDDRWGYYHYDYKQSPYLDPAEIERDKANMDPIRFASEYLAAFKESGNSVFYCFDRAIHVRKDLPTFAEKEDVHAAIDFNVGLQATSLSAIRGGQTHFLDELKGHPDTETLARTIKAKYIDNGHKVYAYPDPSGRARKSSAPVGVTDFSILRAAGINVLSRESAPPIIDSVNAVNRLLTNANDQHNMFVSHNCRGIIESLERTRWVADRPDTASIDKTDGVEHFSDGIRYQTEFLFPVTAGRKAASRGFGF